MPPSKKKQKTRGVAVTKEEIEVVAVTKKEIKVLDTSDDEIDNSEEDLALVRKRRRAAPVVRHEGRHHGRSISSSETTVSYTLGAEKIIDSVMKHTHSEEIDLSAGDGEQVIILSSMPVGVNNGSEIVAECVKKVLSQPVVDVIDISSGSDQSDDSFQTAMCTLDFIGAVEYGQCRDNALVDNVVRARPFVIAVESSGYTINDVGSSENVSESGASANADSEKLCEEDVQDERVELDNLFERTLDANVLNKQNEVSNESLNNDPEANDSKTLQDELINNDTEANERETRQDEDNNPSYLSRCTIV